MASDQVYKAKDRPDEERAQELIGKDPELDLHADPDQAGEAAPLATEAAIPWRVARALLKLRDQVNALAPNRDKASDGTIGDANHQNRSSDHNPYIIDGANGVVTALDITHSPTKGCDAGRIALSLLASRDPRIKYIIWNRKIAASYAVGGTAPWVWRPYNGINPHTRHVHISVIGEKARYDATTPWAVRLQ